MEFVKNKYLYKGKDISFFLIMKIEQVVNIIAKKNQTSFENEYANFLKSKCYQSLQNTNSLMWFENAEFIADEYFRDLNL